MELLGIFCLGGPPEKQTGGPLREIDVTTTWCESGICKEQAEQKADTKDYQGKAGGDKQQASKCNQPKLRKGCFVNIVAAAPLDKHVRT